jgi:hypothetical protein
MDVLICPVIAGDRIIRGFPTSLVNTVLTRAEGFLEIGGTFVLTQVDLASLSYIDGGLAINGNNMLHRVNFASLSYVGDYLWFNGNNMLTRVDFASLSYVGEGLQILYNPALTFASLPLLSQVQRYIGFCQNNDAFLYPRGLTSALFGGLRECQLEDGSGACLKPVNCP